MFLDWLKNFWGWLKAKFKKPKKPKKSPPSPVKNIKIEVV